MPSKGNYTVAITTQKVFTDKQSPPVRQQHGQEFLLPNPALLQVQHTGAVQETCPQTTGDRRQEDPLSLSQEDLLAMLCKPQILSIKRFEPCAVINACHSTLKQKLSGIVHPVTYEIKHSKEKNAHWQSQKAHDRSIRNHLQMVNRPIYQSK